MKRTPGKSTRFKAPPPVVPEHEPPAPPPKIRTIEDWQKSPARVAWWKSVLDTQEGQELQRLLAANSPERLLVAEGKDKILSMAVVLKAAEGSVVGIIAGYERARKFLIETLATGTVPVAHARRVGTLVTPPHSVNLP